MSQSTPPGALVISLDFELHWGMRDRPSLPEELREDLLRSRDLVPVIARELSGRSIRATWATVGFLFATDKEELESFEPRLRPRYSRAGLDPYEEQIGTNEEEDPLHMAGTLVSELAGIQGQEIASHTFSHYYCLEPGQDVATFRADLAAARAIARHLGIEVSSLVLPRNQWNTAYGPAMVEEGFTCVRGPQPSWGHRPLPSGGNRLLRRAARLVESYVGPAPPPTTPWSEVDGNSGLCNVPASAFLRPYSPRRKSVEPLRLSRIRSGLRAAARGSRIFHLWWHPHNFVHNTTQNFDLLRRILDDFSRLEHTDGMLSVNMGDVPGVVSTIGHARS